jgi:hypothetical protein
MPNILLPKWKNGNGSQFMKNLDRYLRYEVDLEKHEASLREQMVRKENEEMGVAKTEGLGQLKGTIPAREYFRWHQSHRGCWNDKSFVKEFFRDNPSFRAKSMTKSNFSAPSLNSKSFA